MKTSLWQRLSPHVIAIAIFFVVSCFYCLPAFKGLIVDTPHDAQGWRGMAQQSLEFKEKNGHYPLWSNSTFSGMPAYQIALESKHNITIAHLHKLFTLFLPEPAGLFFLACIGFYILCVVLRLRNWIGIFGGLAYGFCTYNAVIVSVGHTTKFSSMGYAPAVIAALLLLTQRKYVLGFVCTLLFGTLLFYQNHIQIVYYTLLTALCLGIAYAIQQFRQKQFLHIAKTAGLAAIAGVLAVGSYAVMLMPLNDYAKETMRGGRSELSPPPGDKTVKTKGGLDKDYAFGWSYGIAETFTIMVPRVMGGSSPTEVNNEIVNEFSDHTKTAAFLGEKTGMGEEQANDFVKRWPAYWGDQPSTSGPVYLGAVVCICFILGLIYYRGWHKGWLIAATILGILLSWGKNFSTFNYFIFDYLPLYNKFRAPSMALVIPQLTFPLIACLGLDQFLKESVDSADWQKRFKRFLLATAGVAVVLVALYFTLDFKSEADPSIREQLTNGWLQQISQGKQPTPDMQQQASEFGRGVANSLRDDRRSLYGGDLIRSLILSALTVGLLFLYSRKKLAGQYLLYGLCALSLYDLIAVDLRYLNNNNYIEKDTFFEVFTPTAADNEIKKDTGYFRVFDQSDPSPFQSSRCSYFHNAVGGYHPAKLALYDDLIRYQLGRGNLEVFNMLNTKYFIMSAQQPGAPQQQQQTIARENPGALGPCWFVRNVKFVNNADEEMKALDTFDPKDTVIIDKREQSKIPFMPSPDSSGTIRFLQDHNDEILYESDAASNQFAVFSEIYYPRGWKAWIDGKEAPIVKVNYLLRGLAIPAGKHKIEFKFEPRSYFLGDTISMVVGIISILLLLGGIWYEWNRYRKTNGMVDVQKS